MSQKYGARVTCEHLFYICKYIEQQEEGMWPFHWNELSGENALKSLMMNGPAIQKMFQEHVNESFQKWNNKECLTDLDKTIIRTVSGEQIVEFCDPD